MATIRMRPTIPPASYDGKCFMCRHAYYDRNGICPHCGSMDIHASPRAPELIEMYRRVAEDNRRDAERRIESLNASALKTILVVVIFAIVMFSVLGCASPKVCTMDEWLVTSDCP